jgi:general L-amino acid transport system substrate-binding protein
MHAPSPFFARSAAAALLALAAALPAHAGKTLDAVKSRGVLHCAVSGAAPGFSATDSQGRWQGLDVDLCKAVAAAVLGDPAKVKYVPTTSQNRFSVMQAGEADLMSRNSTYTLGRDASLGLQFAGINYYDGQGFMVPKKLNVASARQLGGAEICVTSGSTTEKNMADYFRGLNLKFKPVVFDNAEAAIRAYAAGRCQVYTSDVSDLSGLRSKLQVPNDHAILPEVISKEPLGPLVRRGDDEWFTIVRWTLNAMIAAEEYGITQANVDKVRAESKDPAVQRLLGTTDDTGKLLGLDKDWAYRIVKAVGNYGESFERHIGAKTPVGLPRGINAQWNKGGLMYAPPIQ